MADPTVTIRVTTNADQASGQLKRATQDFQKMESGAASGARTQRSQRSASTSQDTSSQLLGRMAGAMALSGLGAGVDLFSSYVGSRPGGSRNARRISEIGGGMISGAQSGAMIGGPVGAVIGAAASGLASAFRLLNEEAKEVREGLMGLKLSMQSSVSSISQGRQDDAFYTLLGHKSKSDRISTLKARAEELSTGGKYSVVSLQNQQQEMIRSGKTDTEAYRRNETLLGMQSARLSKVYSALWEEGKMPRAEMLRAGEVGDSLGAMGGSIGAQVDVADVNRSQLEELKRINENLRHYAESHVSSNMVDASVNKGYGGVYILN